MPARRPGACAQKSTIQRLCAWRPAHRSSYSASVGGIATRLELGKNGGIVFGNRISATMPSASRSRRRSSLSQFFERCAWLRCKSANGLSYDASQRSYSSW